MNAVDVMSQDPQQPAPDRIIEPEPALDPATEKTAPTLGTKLFVVFFMLIVPPLGIVLLAAVVWSLWKLVVSNA